MLEEQFTEKQDELALKRKSLFVSLDSDSKRPLRIELPPVEEIVEIREMRFKLVGAEDLIDAANSLVQAGFASEYLKQAKKELQFSKSASLQSRLAQISELSGNIEGSIRHAHRASELNHEIFYKHLHGLFLVRGNQLQRARELFESDALKEDSHSNLCIAMLYLKESRFDLCRSSVNRAIEIDPLNDEARVLSGVLYLLAEEYRKAVSEFRIAVEERPRDSTLFHNMAVAYLYMGQKEKALDAAKRAASINPLKEESVALFADLLMQTGSFEPAQKVLADHVRYFPKSRGILERLALACFKSEMFGECIDVLKTQASFEETSRVLNNIAVAFLKKGDRQKAYQYFTFALQKMSDEKTENFTLLNNFARVLNGDKKYKESLALTSAFLEEKSLEEIGSTVGLGELYVNRLIANYESSPDRVDIDEVNELVLMRSLPQKVRVDLLVYGAFHYATPNKDEGQGLKYAEMIEHLLASAKLSEDERAILVNNAVYTYLEFDRLDCAERLIETLLPFVHHRSFPTATFGLYHLKKGNLKRGEALYNEAISLSKAPSSKDKLRAKMYTELSGSYLSIGEKEKAKNLLARAAKNDSENLFSEKLKLIKSKLGSKK